MWELDHNESWAPKNWCFWTPVLEKTLESPLESKEIKPVNSRENHSEHSLEELVLKLKLQYFDHLVRRANSLEHSEAGTDWGRRGQQRMGWLDGITDSMDMQGSRLWVIEETRGSWRAAAHGVSKGHTWLSNWATTGKIYQSLWLHQMSPEQWDPDYFLKQSVKPGTTWFQNYYVINTNSLNSPRPTEYLRKGNLHF